MLRRVLGVTGLVLLGVGAQQSSGAPGRRNGLIAYEHLGAGNQFQIYTITPTGAHRRGLTHGRRYSSYEPAFSPSGKRIVFVRADGPTIALWTMRADGTGKRRLTAPSVADDFDPVWSPDGKQIAFSVEAPTSQQGIWVVTADGTDSHRLTTGDDIHPSWSPDGTKIAFDRFTYTPGTLPFDQIYVVPTSTGPPTNLSNDPSVDELAPSWSPDGSRILFSSDRGDPASGDDQLDLWTMSAEGFDLGRVTNTVSRDETDPVWSPDDRQIVYSGAGSFDGASSSRIYVSSANGTQRRVLTHACDECAYVNDSPTWQPLP